MVRAASCPWPRVLHVPRPSLAVPAVVLERQLLAADMAVSRRSIVNPVQLIVRVFQRSSTTAFAGLPTGRRFCPKILRRKYEK